MPKRALALRGALLGEFGGRLALSIVAPPKGKAGCFEVSVGGRLVHSKLTMGHGKADSEEELDRLLEHIQAELDARRRPKQLPSDTTLSAATPLPHHSRDA